MNKRILLTLLIVFTLMLPDLVNIAGQNFESVDAEMRFYYGELDRQIQRRSPLIESLRENYLEFLRDYYLGEESLAGYSRENGSGEGTNKEIMNYLTQRMVSQTSKNFLRIDLRNNVLYLISFDNGYYRDQEGYSARTYLTIQKYRDKRLFESGYFVQQEKIYWEVCLVQGIDGVIKSLKFSEKGYSFVILYENSTGHSNFRQYRDYQKCESVTESLEEQDFEQLRDSASQRQTDYFSRMVVDLIYKRQLQKQPLVVEDIAVSEPTIRIQHYVAGGSQVLYSRDFKPQVIRRLLRTQDAPSQSSGQWTEATTTQFSLRETQYIRMMNFICVGYNEFNNPIYMGVYLLGDYLRQYIQINIIEDVSINFQQGSTIYVKEVTQILPEFDITDLQSFPKSLIATNHRQAAILFLNRHLLVWTRDAGFHSDIEEIHISNINKLGQEDFTIQDMQYSIDQGNYLFLLARDKSKQNQRMYMIDFSKPSQLSPNSHLPKIEMYLIKEIKGCLNDFYIKHFLAIENADEIPSQFYKIDIYLLIEPGQLIKLSLNPPYHTPANKSLHKHITEVIQSFLIFIIFSIALLIGRTLLANFSSENDD